MSEQQKSSMEGLLEKLEVEKKQFETIQMSIGERMKEISLKEKYVEDRSKELDSFQNWIEEQVKELSKSLELKVQLQSMPKSNDEQGPSKRRREERELAVCEEAHKKELAALSASFEDRLRSLKAKHQAELEAAEARRTELENANEWASFRSSSSTNGKTNGWAMENKNGWPLFRSSARNENTNGWDWAIENRNLWAMENKNGWGSTIEWALSLPSTTNGWDMENTNEWASFPTSSTKGWASSWSLQREHQSELEAAEVRRSESEKDFATDVVAKNRWFKHGWIKGLEAAKVPASSPLYTNVPKVVEFAASYPSSSVDENDV